MKKYKKALVIGAGSGRDIASAVLLTEGIRRQGTKVDLGGFLTPWALHTFDGKLERPINRPTKDSKKFIPAEETKPLDSYFEPLLVTLNKELDLGIDNFFLFSLQHGTEKLKRGLERLIAENQYDLVLAADVGGDILAREKDLPTLLTPIVDLTCLEMLSDIRTGADRLLAVIAPGVDREIPTERLTEILKELAEKGVVLEVDRFTAQSEDYQKFVEVNEQINRRTTATSGTFETIRKAIGNKPEPPLISSIYLLELRGVRAASDIETIQYDNIIDAYLKLRMMGATATEVDRTLARLRSFLSADAK